MRQDNSKQVQQLTVYPSRENPQGWWCAEHGEITTPPDWDLLQAGDAYVTRKVKELGPHWVVKRHSPSLKLNITLGILAPRINIEKARQLAEESKQRREGVRERSRKQREKTNLKHAEELKRAIIEYLDFDSEFSELADRIAQEATETSTELGSGRVGRTSKLTMKEKARLAARATIRHSYTAYDERLESVKAELYGKLDDDMYREVKQDASQLVDEFLEEHRKKSTNAP